MSAIGCKLLTSGVRIVILFTLINVLSPRINAQVGHCDEGVYDYCWASGRNVDSNTCECNMQSCFGLPESDCTEQGQYLDTSRCICVSNPSYIGVCDNDPFALGCPRSFDTIMGAQIRLAACSHPDPVADPCDPMIGGGDGDICSFMAYAWCNTNGGTWSSYGCACGGIGTTDAPDACGDADGIWYQNICFNPSGFLSNLQCASSTASLASCISSNGYWNPYLCTCTP